MAQDSLFFTVKSVADALELLRRATPALTRSERLATAAAAGRIVARAPQSPVELPNFRRSAMDGFQIAVHAIGDAANAQVLDAIDELSQTYTGDRRWRIEHAQIVDPADIPRFARLGVIASMQPVHQTSDRLMAEARLGPNRLNGAYAWHSMKLAGVRLAF